MKNKGLVAAIECLLIAAVIIGIGIVPTTKPVSKEQILGNQTAASFVNFTLASNNNLTVIFNVSGNYTITNSTTLKIVNETGSIDYYGQINDFPFAVQSLNNTGKYMAIFQPMQITNSTTLTANNIVDILQLDFPLINIAFVGIFFMGASLIFFAWRINEDIIKSLKNETFKNGKELKKPFFKFTFSTKFSFLFFFLFTFLLVFVSNIIVFTFLLHINPLISIGELLSVSTSLVITFVIFAFCRRAMKSLIQIDVRTCFNKIVAIQDLADIANYTYIGIFIYIISLFIFSYSTSSYFLFFPIYAFVVTLAMIHSFFNIFNSMLTKEGNIIVCLSDFIEKYEKKGCDTQFKPLNKASKLLTELIKPYNLTLAEASITAALSYQILVKKDTAKIRKLISHAEETPINYDKLLPLIQVISSQGKMLDSKGLKGLPSFSERAKEYLLKIGPPISLISVIFGIFKYLTGTH